MPTVNEIYLHKRISKIRLNKKDKILCAKHRKGHFEGVIDVMDRLTKLIKPKKIYMGEKDLQQLYLVKKFLKKKHNSKIIQCKTIRDRNKLALSSRNLLLNKRNFVKASKLIQDLIQLKKKLNKKNNISKILLMKKKELSRMYKFKIEYLELRNINNFKLSIKLKNSKLFIAFYSGKIRLIDNI